jgi:hypothetical protein
MCHGPSFTRPKKSLDPMSMVLGAQHKEIPLIFCQINCNNCRYNRLQPSIPLVRFFPLPKHRMYIVCSRRTQRPTSSLKERRNNKTRRLKGKKWIITMLEGEKQRSESQSIYVTFAQRTTQLTCSLDLRRIISYWHSKILMC